MKRIFTRHLYQKRIRFRILMGGVVVFGMGLGLVVFAERTLSKLVLGDLGVSFSTRVYGSPHLVRDGQRESARRLQERLNRLRYKKVFLKPEVPGEYRWMPPSLTIFLRGFDSPLLTQAPGLYEIHFGEKGTVRIGDSGGNPLQLIAIEPELVAELSGPEKIRRSPAEFKEFPPSLIQAVIAAEDKRFFSHGGLDLRAILRALYQNLSHGRNVQGASTITQQLVKNLFLTPRKTFRRKFVEALLAIYMEIRFSKEKILTLYLNHIYMGQDGFMSVAGMKAAAEYYFGTSLENLNLEECATLAGLIRSPHRYNPLLNKKRAKFRRNFVLRRMFNEKMIGQKAFQNARLSPLRTAGVSLTKQEADDNDYFVAEIVRRMRPLYGDDILFRYGLTVYTTLDPLYESIAQSIIQKIRNQGALVALDPQTGAVRALIGGKDYRKSQFNRATQARRQPGSAFKPFVYGAALEEGLTPATLLHDVKKSYPRKTGGAWRPRNFDGLYRGTITMRAALSNSRNAATLDLAEKIGMRNVLSYAHRMGIQSPLENSLATALGASEVTPLELTASYAPFANGGFRVAPKFLTAVLDVRGNLIELDHNDKESVTDSASSFLLTSLLKTVVTEGTAKSLKRRGWTYPSAGKTGTTNGGRDAWFIGYTRDLLVGVWVGDDHARRLRLSGSATALPIWYKFMSAIYQDAPPLDFPRPNGLVSVKIDPLSGARSRSGCPTRREEMFIRGTEPTEKCPFHKGGVIGFFQHLFRKK